MQTDQSFAPEQGHMLATSEAPPATAEQRVLLLSQSRAYAFWKSDVVQEMS